MVDKGSARPPGDRGPRGGAGRGGGARQAGRPELGGGAAGAGGAARFGAGRLRAPRSVRPRSRAARPPAPPACAAAAAAGEATSERPRPPDPGAAPGPAHRRPRPWTSWPGCCPRSCCSARSTEEPGEREPVRPAAALGADPAPPRPGCEMEPRANPGLQGPGLSPTHWFPPCLPPSLPPRVSPRRPSSLQTRRDDALGRGQRRVLGSGCPGAVRRPGAEPSRGAGRGRRSSSPFLSSRALLLSSGSSAPAATWPVPGRLVSFQARLERSAWKKGGVLRTRGAGCAPSPDSIAPRSSFRAASSLGWTRRRVLMAGLVMGLPSGAISNATQL